MTPKEKAFELWLKFRNELDFALDFDICRTYSRRVAILAINEILEITKHESPSTYVYYMEVKQEIEKL